MSCASLHGRAGLNDLAGDLEFLNSYGLFPEIYLPGEQLDTLEDKTVEAMIKWREDGRELTFHAPFVDLSPGGFDPRVLEVTRLRFSQVMELAHRVGPRRIVFHPGYDKWRFAYHEELWLSNSMKIWSEVLEAAETAGTRVCLENVFDNRPDHLGALRDRLGDELGFCLDTGHLLLFSEVELTQWLDVFGSGLIELHLHDNDGTQDQHMPVGEGGFDFKALCCQVEARGLDPVVVLEHHSREETVRSLQNFQSLLEERCVDDSPHP
jgi:sugar phosphate isomerase/epimerase